MKRKRIKKYELKGSSNKKTAWRANSEYLEPKVALVNDFNFFNAKIIRV